MCVTGAPHWQPSNVYRNRYRSHYLLPTVFQFSDGQRLLLAPGVIFDLALVATPLPFCLSHSHLFNIYKKIGYLLDIYSCHILDVEHFS